MDLLSVVSFVERILSTTTLKEESTHDTHQQHHFKSKQPPVCMGSAYIDDRKKVGSTKLQWPFPPAPAGHFRLKKNAPKESKNPKKTLKETQNLDPFLK